VKKIGSLTVLVACQLSNQSFWRAADFRTEQKALFQNRFELLDVFLLETTFELQVYSSGCLGGVFCDLIII